MEIDGLQNDDAEVPADTYGIKARVSAIYVAKGRSLTDDEWTCFLAELANRLAAHFGSTPPKLNLIADVIANMAIDGYDNLDGLREDQLTKKDWVDRFGTSRPARITYDALVKPAKLNLRERPVAGVSVPNEDKKPSPSDLAKASTESPGIGYNEANTFDPSPNGVAFLNLKPNTDTNNQSVPIIARCLQHLGGSRGLATVGESNFVQPRFNEIAKTIGYKAQDASVSYSILGSPSASTSNGNVDGSVVMEDMFNPSKFWALAIWENKGRESSPFAAVRQAAAGYAFGVATGLVGLGIPVDEVLVPVTTCSGNLIQFGAVYVLHPSYPVYTHISPVFDLDKYSQATEAAQYVVKACDYAEGIKRKVRDLSQNRTWNNDECSRMTMTLSRGSRYHLKVVSDIEDGDNKKGFRLLGISSEHGCRHMIRIFNELWEKLTDDVRKFIVFPRGICNKGAVDAKTGKREPLSLIFDNLCWEETPGGPFKIGLPDPSSSTDLWNAWLLELEQVMFIIHNEAGVVHGDLYPSNIMWRERQGTNMVDIRIIDWDAAHSIDRDVTWIDAIYELIEGIVESRNSYGWKSSKTVSADHDTQYLCVLRALDLTNKIDRALCKQLASNDVGEINKAFREAADSRNITNVDIPGYRARQAA